MNGQRLDLDRPPVLRVEMLRAEICRRALGDLDRGQVFTLWVDPDEPGLAIYAAIVSATGQPQVVMIEGLGLPPVMVRLTRGGTLWIDPWCGRPVARLYFFGCGEVGQPVAVGCGWCVGLKDGSVGVVPDIVTTDIAVVQRFRNLVPELMRVRHWIPDTTLGGGN